MSSQDFLDEDTTIGNQKFFILSYILPKDINDQPMLKVRGSFPTVEDCEKRISRLRINDDYFNMYIAEVGKWGALLTEKQIREQELDSVYAEGKMNEIVKGYKENKDKADKEYLERKAFLEKKAKEDGSLEGQKRLAEENNPVKTKIILENIHEQIEVLKKDLATLEENKAKNVKIWESFSDQDIKNSEQEFSEYQKTLQ